MTSTLPPDPYAALGVPKDAPSATIKSTYRKLVLKCHPDKVTDPTLKQQKQEEFHKIQQAYELIGDDDRRQTYDAEVRLEQLRKEKAARAGVEVKTARYDTRTSAPAGATFTANGVPRYEERKPASASASRSYDDYYEDRSRKYDTYDAYPKHSSSSRSYRPEKESSRSSKSSSDRTRSDHKKNRDKEDRRNRFDKFNHTAEESSSADEKMRYEKEFRRRSDDARRQEAEDAEKKAFAEARRKADTRRSYEDTHRSYEETIKEPRRQRSDDRDDRQRKMEDFMGNAVRHIYNSQSKGDHDRPSPGRTSSSREIPRDSYDSRSRRDRERERERPEVRRSSAARPSHRPEPSGRGIQIVDWDERSAPPPPPSFKHSMSSPADLHTTPAPPQRSYTDRSHRRTETSPTPMLRRHETAPMPHSSSRRKEEFVPRSSNLRNSESATPKSSNPPEHSFPTVPPPPSTSSTTKYYYPTSGGGVALHPDDVKVANGRYTVLREPDRHRARSPSPMRSIKTRPPMGENRPKDANYTTTAPSSSRAPPLARAATLSAAEMERGRPRLFAEVSPDFGRSSRPENNRKNSYSPDKVSYSKRYGPDDISWSRGSKRDMSKDRNYKPSLSRHATIGVF